MVLLLDSLFEVLFADGVYLFIEGWASLQLQGVVYVGHLLSHLEFLALDALDQEVDEV